MNTKIDHFAKLTSLFSAFLGVQKDIFWIFSQALWSFCGKSLNIVFHFKSPNLGCILSCKGWYMTWEIEIIYTKLTYFRHLIGWFWNFLEIKKVVFYTFLKLFRSCLGSDWPLFSDLKFLILDLSSSINLPGYWDFQSNFRPWEDNFW